MFLLLCGVDVRAAQSYRNRLSSEQITIPTRIALVGHNCIVNGIQSGIAVGAGNSHTTYMIDDDLSNYMTIHNVVGATLTEGSPLINIKDMEHYYSADTRAGFKVGLPNEVLKLGVVEVNKFRIRYYKDGKIVGESAPLAKGFSLLTLEVGNITADNGSFEIVAEEGADSEYNEVALLAPTGGVDLKVISGLKLFYAFAGDNTVLLTKSGIKDYDPDVEVSVRDGIVDRNHLIDDDLKNSSTGYLTSPVIVTENKAKPGTEVFPAGTEITFVGTEVDILGLGATAKITLYDHKGIEIQDDVLNATVLGLGLGGSNENYTTTAKVPFSQAKFTLTGVSVGGLLGGMALYYAYVVLPDTAGHKCEMSPSADVDICDCDTHYALHWNNVEYPDAEWEIDGAAEGVRLEKDEKGNWSLDFTDAPVPSVVNLRLVNTDGCYETLTVNYGVDIAEKYPRKENILVNLDPAAPRYELADGTSIDIEIAAITKNRSALLTPSLTDYVLNIGGVELAGVHHICGVKAIAGDISDGSAPMKAGFVVSVGADVVDADVLKFYQIRLSKGGEKVHEATVVPAITASLISGGDTRKLRLTAEIPAGVSFDEINLYSTGLLSANLSGMHIYYAFTAGIDEVLDDITEGATLVSFYNTGATINADATNNAGVAVIGQGMADIYGCIDDDLYGTAVSFPTGVDVATAAMLDVKVGKTVSRNQQFIIAVDKSALGLGLGLVDVLQIKTYLNGTEVKNYTKEDWGVLGLDVITVGDHGYIVLNHDQPFDEIKLINGTGANALQNLKIYGFLMRNDANGDGIPDNEDLTPCLQDLVLDEDYNLDGKKDYYNNVRLYLRRSFDPGQLTSLILPVDLTYAQFTEAFGDNAELHLLSDVSEDGTTPVFASVVTPYSDEPVFLRKNTPYAIRVPADEVNKNRNMEYSTIDAGAISGEIYNVNTGVSFDKSDITPQVLTASSTEKEMHMYGSYDPNQTVKSGHLVFADDAVAATDADKQQKSFRCWLDTRDVVMSGIDSVEEADPDEGAPIYTVLGQYVGNDPSALTPGIYIRADKKFVVRR